MKRRKLLSATASILGMAVHRAVTAQQPALPRYRVSSEQMQKALEQRFPLRHEVEDVLNFDLLTPRLSLLHEHNRMGADLVMKVAGPALRHSYTGTMALEFTLRYEPADRSIRAHQLMVKSVRLAGLPSGAAELLDTYGSALAEHALRDAVLHRLRPQDLALADTMGLQPSAITVAPRGLDISFELKQTP